MASRVESMLEKLIGKDMCLVKIKLGIYEPTNKEAISLKSSLRGFPTAVFPQSTEETKTAPSNSTIPLIQSISVIVYLDKSLPNDKIELVKANIPKWLELDYSRGDSLKIELITLPTSALAAGTTTKSASFFKKNLATIIGIAGAFILGFSLFAFLFIPLRKFLKEVIRMETTGKKQMPDFDKLLEDFKNSLSGTPTQNVDTLLEDIKEMLAKSSGTKTDDFLEEIKGILEKMAKTQGPAGAQAAPAAMGGGTSSSVEFLAALKEAISPVSVMASGGGGVSPDVLDALRKIEDLIRRQVEVATTGSKVFDEPFKYLNTLSAKEIALLIEEEPARIVATVLGHIEPSKSASIISSMPEQDKFAVSLAMANLSETNEVVTEIKDFLQRKIPTVKLRSDFLPIAGNKTLANILSSIPYNVSSSILENIEKQNPALAKTIRNEIFLFEDIANLDDSIVAETLKGIDIHRVSLALSIATDKTREKFYKNAPAEVVESLKKSVEESRPEYIEGAPKKIIAFEDIVGLDDKTIQYIFTAMDRESLKVALKGTSEEVRQKFYVQMTERGAAMLKEDIEVMPPVPLAHSEEVQRKILDKIHELENERLVAQQEILEKIKALQLSGRTSA